MKALSIRQPFADAILAGLKNIEFRAWPTAHRGPLLIHASASVAAVAWPGVQAAGHVYGAILGLVDLVDCHLNEDTSIEPYDCFHWLLANPRRFVQPVLFRGKLRLFDVPEAVVPEVLTLRAASR